jgi:selenocysteine-specific elongation factor
MTRTIHPVMVGTAGHIDHGKSSLVRALTGVDPDRLKEEKERGLTIDLGFAPLRLGDGRTMGMVDVPGHERFVRNMVAGSTGLDLAILVVAADDSVMPQTLEHLEILDLLGVRRGIVALNKVDLVDEETLLLAEEEVRETLAGTSLAGAEIVRVSATTGRGLAEFRERLESLAVGVSPRSHDGPIRMPIQRVFQLKGIGTVVTGIPGTGAVAVGDEVEFQPVARKSRVRAIQAYGGPVERAIAGHSAALSVPDAKAADLRRGVVAAAPGVFQSATAVDLDLRVLPRGTALRHRAGIRFHTGTSEVRGVLCLLEGDAVEPGTTVVARVLLDEPVCCAFGDAFLLRRLNPARTVGGGTVLRLSEAPRRYRRAGLAEQVRALVDAGADPAARVLEALRLAGPAGQSAAEIAAALSITQIEASALLRAGDEIHFHARGGRAFLRSEIESGTAEVLESVSRMLRDKPLAASVSRAALRTSRTLPAALKDAVLDHLQDLGRVRAGAHGRVLFVDRLASLAAPDQRDLERIVDRCRILAFRPPTAAELAADLGIDAARLANLVARALDEVAIEQVGEHLYSAETVRQALLAIRENCLRHDEVLDIPELRDALGTSRKYLIPLLEYVDGLGLTRLRGGERRLLASSDICVELGRIAASGERSADRPMPRPRI